MASQSFGVKITGLVRKAQADIDLAVRKATFELFNKIVLRSPVDTGRFRANWNVSYAQADTSVTLSTNQNRGTKEAAKALTYPTGGVVYLSNGLPYAQRLETGWSQQAPIGMVRVSIVEFEKHMSRSLRSK